MFRGFHLCPSMPRAGMVMSLYQQILLQPGLPECHQLRCGHQLGPGCHMEVALTMPQPLGLCPCSLQELVGVSKQLPDP